jgi:DUF4097 and DUF4098 domain-containing protein YvlB
MVNPVAIMMAGGMLVVASAWPFTQVVKQTDTSSHPIAPHGTLSVENLSGNIRVDAYGGSTVNVVAHRQASSSDVVAQVRVEATASGGNVSIKSMYPSHCVNCEISYEIQVPRSTALAATDASGDINVTAIDGDTNVTTESGDIHIHQAGGRVIAKAASGNVTVDGAASSLLAKTASGDISITGAVGSVDARASSGNVTARFASIGSVAAIKLEAASGDVLLAMPRGAGAAISATTEAGSIQSDFGQAPRAGYAGATLAQTIGDGRVKVDLSAASGSIRLRAL